MKKLKGITFANVLVFIVMVIIIVAVGTNTKNDANYQNKTVQKTQEQRQKQLDTVNNLIKALAEDGLIVKYKEPMYFYVNESMWNALPYDTKEQIINVFMERYRLTNAPYTLVGYRSGERIQDAKNFK